MYLSETDTEKNELRQGDIIKNTHCFGAINSNSINYIKNNNDELVGWNCPNKPEFLDVMVLSHSCEISKDNGVKMTSIILAPIRDINSATSPAKIEEVKNSNIITNVTTASFLKYFYIFPSDKLQYKNGAIVDFSKIFSVRKQAYDLLLENKILQLEEAYSNAMALKNALYYYRKEDITTPPSET